MKSTAVERESSVLIILFHQELGVPFHEHLPELRVCRAKTLLAERQLRIAEIAYTIGFNDVSHAIGWTGSSPTYSYIDRVCCRTVTDRRRAA